MMHWLTSSYHDFFARTLEAGDAVAALEVDRVDLLAAADLADPRSLGVFELHRELKDLVIEQPVVVDERLLGLRERLVPSGLPGRLARHPRVGVSKIARSGGGSSC